MIAGLEDLNLEFFVNENKEVKAIYNGSCIKLADLPSNLLNSVFRAILLDSVAIECIQKLFGKNSVLETVVQYIKCNSPIINEIPDFDTQAQVFAKEIWDCPSRNQCSGFGKICKPITGVNGTLTTKETTIFFLTIRGYLDKEIADITQTSISTIETHQRHIRCKLAANNRIEYMLIASQCGIKIDPNNSK